MGALYWGWLRVQEVRPAIARTENIERQVRALAQDVVDAAAAQRAFLLGAKPQVLQPYQELKGLFAAKVQALRALMTDPSAKAKLATLEPAFAAAIREMDREVALVQGGQFDAAKDQALTSAAQRHLDEFQRLSGDVIEIEQQLLESRRAEVERKLGHVLAILLSGGSAVIVLLLLLALRAVRRLGQPIDALLVSIGAMDAGQLDRRVKIGARDEVGRIGLAFNAMADRLREAVASRDSALGDLQRLDAEQKAILNSPLFGIAKVRDHTIQWASPGLERVLGYGPGELNGMPTRTGYPGDGARAHAGAQDYPVVGAGGLYRGEHPMVRKDGRRIWVELSGQGLDASSGQSLWLFVDCTARKSAEQALRSSKAFLERTGALAGVGGWEVDIASGEITWSDQTCRIHDVEPGYRPSLDQAVAFYAPEARPQIEQAVRTGIELGQPWDLELPLISAKGRPFWARAVGAAEFDSGKLARLVGAFQDITERRAMQQALAESHELLRVTLESIGDAVITTDASGIVTWLNPVAERMTGWLVGEACGKPSTQVFRIVNEATRDTAPDPVASCLEMRETVGLANHTVLISRDAAEYAIEDSAAPIRAANGTVLGAVLVFHDVSQQRKLSREITHRATHDALTGIANRTEFEARLNRLLERSRDDSSMHALMYIDLDQFKLVNDACGHAVGDQLLKQISAVLQRNVRGRDTVARLGGDEFGLILEHCDTTQAQRVAQSICDQMEEFRFLHDGRRFRVGTSIGLVPMDARWHSIAALLQAADSACYAAKEEGRNRVHVWFDTDSAMQTRKGEIQWASRLEQALDDSSFELYAQRIEPTDGSIYGLHCEVLLRLLDADGSVIAPNAFLPAAERFHLASRIDRWVLRRVFDWMRSLGDAEAEVEMISVNLSGQSIGDRTFHQYVERMVRSADFDVRRICLEITETAAITNLQDAKSFIDSVRVLGVRIALDDFGAGASSFGYLKTLPVDYLKIDGQFIRQLLKDPLDSAAVRCFREVARVVGVKSIAEYVEDQGIRDALQEIGVDLVQGYLIHRPEPLSQLISREIEQL